jgi:rare lipoprotein A
MLRFLSSLLLLGATIPSAQAAAFQCGQASHYGIGDGYHGQRTASGQRFDAYAMTAAHPSLPLGSRVIVKNRDNGKSVLVTSMIAALTLVAACLICPMAASLALLRLLVA